MKETTQQIIERIKLIPVFRAESASQAHALVRAIVTGGVNIIEVTMTVPDAVGLIRTLKEEYGESLLLGSGTVTTAQEAEATIRAGAEFVVSPMECPANSVPEGIRQTGIRSPCNTLVYTSI